MLAIRSLPCTSEESMVFDEMKEEEKKGDSIFSEF